MRSGGSGSVISRGPRRRSCPTSCIGPFPHAGVRSRPRCPLQLSSNEPRPSSPYASSRPVQRVHSLAAAARPRVTASRLLYRSYSDDPPASSRFVTRNAPKAARRGLAQPRPVGHVLRPRREFRWLSVQATGTLGAPTAREPLADTHRCRPSEEAPRVAHPQSALAPSRGAGTVARLLFGVCWLRPVTIPCCSPA